MKSTTDTLLLLLLDLAFLCLLTHSAPLGDKREFFKPHGLTVCRGQMRSIACPNLELIHIFNAFYGKLSGHDCTSSVTQLRDQIPTCFSKNAPGFVKETCNGQQSCDLYAEDSLYDDPCPSVTKYLFVSFTCQGKSQLNAKLQNLEQQKTLNFVNQALPAVQQFIQQKQGLTTTSNDNTALVCTGQSRSIVCPALQLLKIKTAFYGKEAGKDCNVQHTTDLSPTCFAHDTLNAVKDMCEGQQSCDLFAEPDLYGKSSCPPSIQKYLQVSYSCDGKSNLNNQLTGRSIMPQLSGSNTSTDISDMRDDTMDAEIHGSQYFGGSFGRNPQRYLPNIVQKQPYLSYRSFLPGYEQDKYYNMWKSWANENEINQWQRSAIPWSKATPPTMYGIHPQITQISMGTPLSEIKFMFPDYDAVERATQQAQLRQIVVQTPHVLPQLRQTVSQPPQMSTTQTQQQQQMVAATPQPQVAQQPRQSTYDPLTYPVLPNFVSNPSRPCEQCNGDCNNFVCYGCGGCPVPPPEKQTYAYSYQKQDANYHDAFAGHEMDLSGMVMFPVPPMPKPPPKVGKRLKGKSDTPSDDDDDNDDDNDDDDDDDADEDVGNFDDDDVDDETDDNNDNSKKSQKSPSKKSSKLG